MFNMCITFRREEGEILFGAAFGKHDAEYIDQDTYLCFCENVFDLHIQSLRLE